MCKVISLADYQSKKPDKIEDPDAISEQELADLEEFIWQACKSVGLDQFFINLFSGDMPEGEYPEKGEEKDTKIFDKSR